MRLDQEIDVAVRKITAGFRDDAREYSKIIGDCLRRAASEVTQSQRSWQTYREHHCQAIAESLTTGSGSGTAYELCRFRLGLERLRNLKSDFLEE